MTVQELITALQQHKPDAEVHIVNDRGYYKHIGRVDCTEEEGEWVSTWAEDGEESADWVEAPWCDGSCRHNCPVVLHID